MINVSQTPSKLQTSQRNLGYVISVYVDADRKECGRFQSRTNQTVLETRSSEDDKETSKRCSSIMSSCGSVHEECPPIQEWQAYHSFPGHDKNYSND